MTQVKICGITREEDAHACATLGADFIGFVFVPSSPRFITPGAAARIAKTLDPVARPKLVGVFRDAPCETVARVAAGVPLDYVQLHGDESEADFATLPLPAIKAVRVGETLPDTAGFASAQWLLFDTLDERRGGGTGRRFDWSLLAQYQRARPFFLAGGITPDNAAAAISAVRPDSIDVSSGVESAPGIKDLEKLRQLFERVRS